MDLPAFRFFNPVPSYGPNKGAELRGFMLEAGRHERMTQMGPIALCIVRVPVSQPMLLLTYPKSPGRGYYRSKAVPTSFRRVRPCQPNAIHTGGCGGWRPIGRRRQSCGRRRGRPRLALQDSRRRLADLALSFTQKPLHRTTVCQSVSIDRATAYSLSSDITDRYDIGLGSVTPSLFP